MYIFLHDQSAASGARTLGAAVGGGALRGGQRLRTVAARAGDTPLPAF
jgi:hypothetical protein